jgi:RimJ/RimL family protein N-acetyltransferase
MALLESAGPEEAFSGLQTLRTERLLLRAPAPSDASALVRLLSERRIAENTLRIPHPYELADARAFINSANTTDDEIVFLIIPNGAGVIGACGIARMTDAGREIGYWIGVPFWGRGYATEAARAVIDHAFGEFHYELLLAGARVSNPASRRVLEKCGFEWTGVALGRIRALRASVPIDRFRLDRSRWAVLKKTDDEERRTQDRKRGLI